MRRREFITFLPALLPGHSPHARKTEASSFGSDFSVRLAQTVCGNAQRLSATGCVCSAMMKDGILLSRPAGRTATTNACLDC
jgi:hypothetical protein